MLGLAFLIVGLVYVLLSVFLINFAVKKAKEKGVAGWKWGVPTALVMYLLVFWDYIPTLVAHKYYCDKDAGFTVYKTLDEWKKENPGVAETLTYEEKVNSKKEGNKVIYYLNERFDSVTTRARVFLSVKERKYQVIDKLNNKILAEYIDFSSGGGFQNANELMDYKMWLANSSCEKRMKKDILFFEYREMAKKIGETVK